MDSAASQKEQENLPSEKEVDSFGKTPLHIACTYGQLSMVEKLLKVISQNRMLTLYTIIRNQ